MSDPKTVPEMRTRIAKALYGQILHPVPPFDEQPDEVRAAWLADADAVIEALDLANPCAATGCRMRQIARRHADMAGKGELLNMMSGGDHG